MASGQDIRAGGAFVELYLKGGNLVEKSLDKIAANSRAFASSLETMSRVSSRSFGAISSAVSGISKTISTILNTAAKYSLQFISITSKAISDFVNSIPKVIQSVGNAMQNIGKTLIAGGGIGAAGIGVTLGFFMEYERQMSRVKALTNTTAKTFAEMTEVVRHLGRTTQYTATEAAEGMAYLAMAGLDARSQISMLPVVLDVATAAMMDLGQGPTLLQIYRLPSVTPETQCSGLPMFWQRQQRILIRPSR